MTQQTETTRQPAWDRPPGACSGPRRITTRQSIFRHIVLGLCLASVAGTAAAGLTVRVDPAGGAPRLVVNGQPVRARMFFGAPGSAPIPIAPTGREVRFEFVASDNATNGTMHFRFGPTPGAVFLDDIQVVDLDALEDVIPLGDFEAGPASHRRDWTWWPMDTQNTVGTVDVAADGGRAGSAALRVTLKPPPDGNWPDFHVYHSPRLKLTLGHRYRVSFWARAEPGRDVTVAFYRPGQTFVHLGGPQGAFQNQIKLAAAAGVNFVSFPIDLPWPEPPGRADWSGVDAQCGAVLRANPSALLLPRMGLDPPAWWRAAHADDAMQWEDGRRDRAVVASPQYRKDAAERLAALVTHLEARFGDQVAGYHPCGQNTGEWFYEGTWERPLSGYAPGDRTAWRRWARERYGSNAALQAAWRDPQASFDTATVPTPAELRAAPAGAFRDPVAERRLVDWNEFRQEAMADAVCELAGAVRRASQGRKLVVFFYGYVFEFGAVPNGLAVAGHYALRRVLNCPDIDVLCSPISYFDRGLGQGAPSMTAAESVALAGKLWLNEDDTHTYLASGRWPGVQDHVGTLDETVQELRRNVAQEAVRNFGTWWMDLGATGWFNDAGLWAEMARLRAIDQWFIETPTPFRPEVAAIVDERSALRLAGGNGTRVSRPVIYESRAALGRMGAPYGQYLLDDVLTGRVRAKLYVFLNAWRLGQEDRARLLEVTRGAARLWCYAPGYLEDHRVSPEGMRQLTGFDLVRVTPASAAATPTDAGRRLGMQRVVGEGDAPPMPLFAAGDATDDEVLARYPDGAAAVAMRRTADGLSLFAGVTSLTSELLRVAARAGGVHLHTETDCNVYANGPFVALHAAVEGPVRVDVGRRSAVTDALTGERLGIGPQITLRLKRGETRILKAGEEAGSR